MGGPAIELRLLGLAVIIGLVQLVWATAVGSRQRSRASGRANGWRARATR
jgi:hypothetical protein